MLLAASVQADVDEPRGNPLIRSSPRLCQRVILLTKLQQRIQNLELIVVVVAAVFFVD
jgi:hypothetical protein